MIATQINQSEIKRILINEVIAGLGCYPMSFNTITLRLLMLADLPRDIEQDGVITIPTKNYIAVYGASNGNNSGAYLSIKKAVTDLKKSNFFKSVVYSSVTGKKATYTQIGFFHEQLQDLSNFLKVSDWAKLCDFSSLRSNHALRFYLFLNYLLKNLKPLHHGRVTVHLNAKEIRTFLGVPDEDYKVVGNFWSLVLRLCEQINLQTNIEILESGFIGQTSHKEMYLTFRFKQKKG